MSTAAGLFLDPLGRAPGPRIFVVNERGDYLVHPVGPASLRSNSARPSAGRTNSPNLPARWDRRSARHIVSDAPASASRGAGLGAAAQAPRVAVIETIPLFAARGAAIASAGPR